MTTPNHYGGEDNPFEPIKIIEHYGLNFHIGNVIKYLLRAGRKEGNAYEQDIRKSIHYLQIELAYAQKRGIPRMDSPAIEEKPAAPFFAVCLASLKGDEMPSRVLLFVNNEGVAREVFDAEEKGVQGFFMEYEGENIHVYGLNHEGDDGDNPLILSLPRASTYVYS